MSERHRAEEVKQTVSRTEVEKLLEAYGREALQTDIENALNRLVATKFSLDLQPGETTFFSFPLQHGLHFNFSAWSEDLPASDELPADILLHLRYGISYGITDEDGWRYLNDDDPRFLAHLERTWETKGRIQSSGRWGTHYQRRGLVTPLAMKVDFLADDVLEKSTFHRGKQVTSLISDVSFYTDSEGNVRKNNFTQRVALELGYKKETGTSTYAKNYKSLMQILREWL